MKIPKAISKHPAFTRLNRVIIPVFFLAVYFFSYSIVSAASIISQGFLTNSKIPEGSIVSLKKNTTDTVEPASIDNVNNMLGVVIDSTNPPVTLSNNQNNQAQIATTGVEKVLVSDINGNVNVGDSITSSPIAGVGMKATSNTRVIGVAQDSFPNSTAKKQSYKDKAGQSHNVSLGEIPILVNVADFFKQPDKTVIPQAIQSIANALAGKKVNSLPIIISIAIFIVTLIVVVSIIYSMIHSSIISVGRNPMSQSAVYRNVIQISLLVFVILMVAVASIYMILRKF
jgi:hypothetical protein